MREGKSKEGKPKEAERLAGRPSNRGKIIPFMGKREPLAQLRQLRILKEKVTQEQGGVSLEWLALGGVVFLLLVSVASAFGHKTMNDLGEALVAALARIFAQAPNAGTAQMASMEISFWDTYGLSITALSIGAGSVAAYYGIKALIPYMPSIGKGLVHTGGKILSFVGGSLYMAAAPVLRPVVTGMGTIGKAVTTGAAASGRFFISGLRMIPPSFNLLIVLPFNKMVNIIQPAMELGIQAGQLLISGLRTAGNFIALSLAMAGRFINTLIQAAIAGMVNLSQAVMGLAIRAVQLLLSGLQMIRDLIVLGLTMTRRFITTLIGIVVNLSQAVMGLAIRIGKLILSGLKMAAQTLLLRSPIGRMVTLFMGAMGIVPRPIISNEQKYSKYENMTPHWADVKATDRELYMLNNVAYDSTSPYLKEVKDSRYIFLNKVKDEKTGYEGLAYLNKDTGQLVIVSKGTDYYGGLNVDGKDLDDDLQIVVNITPEQVDSAMKFYHDTLDFIENNPDYKERVTAIAFTGHSLGGRISQILSKKTGNAALTFNAPGEIRGFSDFEETIYSGMGIKLDPYDEQVRNYSIYGDPIGAYLNDTGRSITLGTVKQWQFFGLLPPSFIPFDYHGLENYETLKRDENGKIMFDEKGHPIVERTLFNEKGKLP